MRKAAIETIEEDEYEARVEFFRQKQCIQSRIVYLTQMIASISTPKESNNLLLEENMRLLKEIDILRENAKMYLTKYNNLKYFLPSNHSEKELRKKSYQTLM